MLFLSLGNSAQNTVNLVIFSEEGDAFFVYVNGIKQNEVAQSNVKLVNISPNMSVLIEFENKALPRLKQVMALEPGFEHTARIRRDPKKKVKLRYFGSIALDGPASPQSSTTEYNTADDTDSQADGNINITGTGTASTAVNKSATVTTTGMSTTTSVQSSSGRTEQTRTLQSHVPGNTCTGAMSSASFPNMKESVAAKPFSDTKMSTAKLATKNNCMSVSQIKVIAALFTMDDDKLAYAKYAYDFCVDKANYYQVNEVFSFSSTADQLNAFLLR